MKIRKEILEQLQEIKKIRQRLHMYPEIGFNTLNTLQIVKECVGIEPDISDGYSGVFYLPSNGDCIGFRCELDALPMKEKNDIDYKSKNHYMHACGHDMHMAIMIITIRYFLSHVHKNSLVFIFQPAEESGAGALYMIQQGIFEKYQIKELYACHVLPNLGDFIGCKKGLIMAQSSEIEINIEGIGGHITKNKTIDAMKTATYFLNSLYKIENELKPHIIHIGILQSGEICNSVASHATLKGTIRSFDPHIFNYLKEYLNNNLKELDFKYHTKSSIHFSLGYPALINDDELVNKIKQYSEDDYIEIQALSLSEDFSYYKEKCKICYLFCGLTTQYELHSSNFDLNEEECLKIIELYIRIIESSTFNLMNNT